MPQIANHTSVFSPATVDRLLKFSEVRTTLGLSKSTIYRMLQRGELPQPIKIGALVPISAERSWPPHRFCCWKKGIACNDTLWRPIPRWARRPAMPLPQPACQL